MPERPVDTKFVADLLGVTQQQVRNLANDLKRPLPHIRIGRTFRFFLSDVQKYFNIPADKMPAQPTRNGANNE